MRSRAPAALSPARGPGRPDGREVRRRREAGPGAPPEAGRRRGPRHFPRPPSSGRVSRPQAHPSPHGGALWFPNELDLAPLRAPSPCPRQSILGTSGYPPEHRVKAEPFIYSLLHPTRFDFEYCGETFASQVSVPPPLPPRRSWSSLGPSLNPTVTRTLSEVSVWKSVFHRGVI